MKTFRSIDSKLSMDFGEETVSVSSCDVLISFGNAEEYCKLTKFELIGGGGGGVVLSMGQDSHCLRALFINGANFNQDL